MKLRTEDTSWCINEANFHALENCRTFSYHPQCSLIPKHKYNAAVLMLLAIFVTNFTL